MNNRTITAKVRINNLPNHLLNGYVVARLDITIGRADLWYYGCYETEARANEVAVELRNGIVFKVEEV